MTAIFYLFTIIALAITVRPIGVFIHEMGHGLTSLLLTEGKVNIYIGSYADRENSYHFAWQRLSFYIKKDWLDWTHGLCEHSNTRSLRDSFLITLFGPVASLLSGLFALLMAKLSGDIQLFAFWFYMLGIAGIVDFIYNIIPQKKPIILADGSETYNDGRSLLMILQNRSIMPLWDEASKYYEEKKYAKAAAIFQKIAEEKPDLKDALKYAAYAYLLAEDELRGDLLFQKYNQKFKASALDFIEFGWIYCSQYQYEKGVQYFQQALQKNPNNIDAKHNIGYTFLMKKNYRKAIEIAEEVLAKDPKYPYAYNSRGLALSKLGQQEKGFKDLEKARALASEDPYIELHFGIWYYDLGQYKTALTYFKTAEKINPNTHQLADYLTRTQSNLGC